MNLFRECMYSRQINRHDQKEQNVYEKNWLKTKHQRNPVFI